MPKSLRRNPGWKLEPETIDIVAAARGKLGLTNAEVIDLWANAWQKEQAEGRTATLSIGDVTVDAQPLRYEAAGLPGAQDKPMAERVETPYQIQRREKLEALRAQLASGGSGALEEVVAPAGGEALVFPFEVLVNGERHEVIEFKGRKVLQWVGPTSKVMMKNLTPQETVIYWRDRVTK